MLDSCAASAVQSSCAFVQPVDEAVFIQLSYKARVGKIFRLCAAGFGILLAQLQENFLNPIQRRVGFGRNNGREKLVAILHGVSIVHPHVFRDNSLAELSLSLIDEDSFNQSSREPPDSFLPIFDESTGSSDGCIGIGTAKVRWLRKTVESRLARKRRYRWLSNQPSDLSVLD